MPTHRTVRAVEWRSCWSKGAKVNHVTVVVRLRDGSLPELDIAREVRASDQVVTPTELMPRPDELLVWTTMPTTLPCPCCTRVISAGRDAPPALLRQCASDARSSWAPTHRLLDGPMPTSKKTRGQLGVVGYMRFRPQGAVTDHFGLTPNRLRMMSGLALRGPEKEG